MSAADLGELLARGKEVVARDVVVNGTTVKGHFRRLTAGERYQLLKGQKVTRSGGATTFELDLALNEEQQQRYVLFCTCKPDGSPYFKDLDHVRGSDGKVISALYLAAKDVNEGGEDDPGKD